MNFIGSLRYEIRRKRKMTPFQYAQLVKQLEVSNGSKAIRKLDEWLKDWRVGKGKEA